MVVVAVIFAGGGYYAGAKYGAQQSAGVQDQNRTVGGGGQGRGRFGNGGGASGTIIAKDASSITIQLSSRSASSTPSETGSRIVLYDTSTQVGEFKTGALTDLSVGQSVSVQGTPNADGSIMAQMIQIRPVGMGSRGGL